MQTFAAFAILIFVLGLFFGLPYQEAHKRHQNLGLDNKPAPKPDPASPLDKPAARV